MGLYADRVRRGLCNDQAGIDEIPDAQLNAISLAALLELATIPLFGHLSDRFGRRPLYFFGVAFTMFSRSRCSGCST
jgi:MFS family permease